MNIAPIVLFVYNRPDHTRKTLEALQKNELSGDSELFAFSDGPKYETDIEKVKLVRRHLKSISGFKKVTIIERDRNLGLAQSIIAGVTEIVNKFGRIVVLEDDIVTSPYFLKYMNEALDMYADDRRVASITGWCFPTKRYLPETFFLRGAEVWGWATWRRGWDLFKTDSKYLLNELRHHSMTHDFDMKGLYPFTRTLEEKTRGKNESWDVMWHASVFLEKKLSLYPGRTLVHNIGNDGSGVHCGTTKDFDSPLSNTDVELHTIPVEPSEAGMKAYKIFLRKTSTFQDRVKWMVYRNKDLVKRIFPSSVLGFVRKSISRDGRIRLEGEFPNWEKANARHAGYDDPKILEKVLDATLKVKRGEAAYERDSVIFDRIEYSWPLLAGLMWAAAEYGGRLNVLDFGGALGSSYFQNRKFLQTMRDIHWNIVEQSHFVEAGKANIQDNQIRFYKSLKECMDENRPHVLLLSSVIQYLKEPEKLLDEITQLGIDTILIDRTSFTADGGRKCLYIQHVPESIYMARYPIWLFNENEFVESITSKGYALIESFNSLDELDDRGIWKGFIFKSTHIHTCRI